MTQPVIRIEHLGKAFHRAQRPVATRMVDEVAGWLRSGLRSSSDEQFWALKDVSLDIHAGEVVGLIGHNGAGKSTLLKLLCQILHPTTGRIELRGRVGSLLEVGTGFHPELTGRENIYLNGAILGMSRREIAARFDEIVAFSEVEQFLDMPVKRYSSGMAVRLAFAVAAHLEPEIMLIDEVLAVGDAEFQKKCLGRIGEVARSGRTIVFVSHNAAAVQRLCTRAVLLDHGRAALFDSVSDALKHYLSSELDSSVWVRSEAPADQPHLERVSLTQPDGQPLDVPDAASQFALTIDYHLTRSAPGVLIAAAICNAFGTPLFSSATPDAGVSLPEQPGRYRVRLVFPEAFFMPRRFTVTVALYSLGEAFDRAENCLTFDVAEAASLATSLPGGRLGELQVPCAWSVVERTAAAAERSV
ncbi:MAG: ABC transporter ATP-binding protein [Planctomycetaceae bacterium]|nr:ABC transporter ATP-binding protein [Planctomycetaceae bacterium]